jgi:hypothetical protein
MAGQLNSALIDGKNRVSRIQRKKVGQALDKQKPVRLNISSLATLSILFVKVCRLAETCGTCAPGRRRPPFGKPSLSTELTALFGNRSNYMRPVSHVVDRE